VKFILTLVIFHAVCAPQFQWPQKFDSFYDCARIGYKAAELRLVELGQTYVDTNRTTILFSCKEISEI
jgi:hypothetical protein